MGSKKIFFILYSLSFTFGIKGQTIFNITIDHDAFFGWGRNIIVEDSDMVINGETSAIKEILQAVFIWLN